ncbi:alpha/beta hydrolase [Achromobacter deleyi]|uniref:Alpha/beta hydrolase n=1 Tax=Achromobacter deleyi TaxID=1353891 RepID=A0A7T4B993_9BURK|nr:prolyl oligopeptidase family serine peptidase [Achromobacter deleyi]QQB37902.1 alpha/beta hydrolase [Achromobacter deleyi]
MWRLLLAAATTLAACLPAHAQLIEHGLLPRPDGSSIAYYLKQRDAARAADSLLVVMQGSDCNSVAHNRAIREQLWRALPAADVLTVDKYGIDAGLPYQQDDGENRADCPRAYLLHDNFDQRVRDYEAVIALLRRHGAYRRVVALGGSEGAVVANLLAARGGSVDASIAFNGGGRWFLDDVLHTIEAADTPADAKAASAAGFREFAAFLRDTPSSDLVASSHGHAWWRQALALDQQAALGRVRTPLLIVQGGRDASVSPGAVERMVEDLRREGRRNIAYRVYPRLDHGLRDADGASRMGEVAEDMAAWLRDLPAY